MTKVTQTNLICFSIELMEQRIGEFEKQKTGIPNIDKMLDNCTKPWRENLETLLMMYEIENGTPYYK